MPISELNAMWRSHDNVAHKSLKSWARNNKKDLMCLLWIKQQPFNMFCIVIIINNNNNFISYSWNKIIFEAKYVRNKLTCVKKLTK